MTTVPTDRIAELERKLNVMSEQMDLLVDELREQRLRRKQWDDLRSDLSPIAGEAMALASSELEAIQEWVQPEDIMHLLRRVLRNTKNVEIGLARFESLMDLVDDTGPLTSEAFTKVLVTLEDLDRRGYFEFATAGLGVADKIVAAYSKEDIDALGDNIVQMLNIVRDLTQPEILAVARRTLDAAQDQRAAADLEPAEPPGLFWLASRMRDPAVRSGLARAFNTFKAVSASETETAAAAIEVKQTQEPPEGGA